MSASDLHPESVLAGATMRPADESCAARAASWIRRWWFSLTPQALVGGVTMAGLTLSLVFTVAFAYRSQVQLTESARATLHALQVDEQGQQLLAAFNQSENAVRAYLFTRSEDSLAFVLAARKAMNAPLAELRRLTAASTDQQARLDKLVTLVDARFALTWDLAANVRAQREKEVMQLALSEKAFDLTGDIRAAIATIVDAERSLASERQQHFAGRTQSVVGWLSFFVAINLVALVGVLVMIHRAARMQRFVKVCAWSKSIEYEGEWLTFEQYLARRFDIHASHGISPEEAKKMMGEMPESFAATGAS